MKEGGEPRAAGPSLQDCICPVCIEILIEPVTLPCTHTFCKACFLESVDKATMSCALCRRRVSTWTRQQTRNKTLVDQKLWTHIQDTFPQECQRRLSGQETTGPELLQVCVPRVSEPGELRQEYEEQLSKVVQEQQQECRASEELIQQLLAEEQNRLQEERRRQEEDERLARVLSNELNAAVAATPRSEEKKEVKKKEVVGSRPMDRFLCPRPPGSSVLTCSFVSNKENVLHLEESRGGPSSTKRKSCEQETREKEEEGEVSKRVCPPLSISSLQEVSEWEMEFQRRRQQEAEDRRLALLLQKEMDKEEKQKKTNRRKGSMDAYLLRPRDQPGGQTPSPSSSAQSSSALGSAASSPSSSSSSPFSSSSSPSSSSVL